MSDSGLIPAATILIARDSASGPEVFMVVRHHEIDFASGALVFPGGKVDKPDFDPALRDHCRDVANLDDEALALRIGGIREAFEECGILLAREKGSVDLISAQRLSELEVWRERFNNRDANMLEFAASENLEFAVDALGHFAHWITPEMMKKRFDTHFFVAHAPADHIGLHDGSESVDSIWITAQQALADAEAKKRTVIFPTKMNLEMFAQHATVDAALAACGSPVTVQPFIEKEGEKIFLRIQPDAGYGDPKMDITKGGL